MEPLFYLIDSEPIYYCALLPEKNGNGLKVYFAGDDWHMYLGLWETFEPIGQKIKQEDIPTSIFLQLQRKKYIQKELFS